MNNKIENIFFPKKVKEDFSHYFNHSEDYGSYDINTDYQTEYEEDSWDDDSLDSWGGDEDEY